MQLARCFWGARVIFRAVRDRCPQGPAPRQWAVELSPNTQRGPLPFFSLCNGCQSKALLIISEEIKSKENKSEFLGLVISFRGDGGSVLASLSLAQNTCFHSRRDYD